MSTVACNSFFLDNRRPIRVAPTERRCDLRVNQYTALILPPPALLAKASDQADCRRRRHQPSRPPLAKIRPGRPAPATGIGTAAGGTVTGPRVTACRAAPWLAKAPSIDIARTRFI